MSAQVIQFDGDTINEIDPDLALDAAIGKLNHCVILGWTHDGEYYAAGSSSKIADNLLLASMFKQYLIDSAFGADEE